MGKPKYSIVIPAYKEEKYISKTLPELLNYLNQNHIFSGTEVIVVTADAPDKTDEIVESYSKKFNHFQHIRPGAKVGKGRDVKIGMRGARGDFIIFMDADGATPLYHINDVFLRLEEGDEVVVGVRELHTIHTGYRKLTSLLAHKISWLLIDRHILDTQCGFKGFTALAGKEIFNRITVDGWAFDMEIITIARQHSFRIMSYEIPDWQEKKSTEDQLAGETGIIVYLKSFTEAVRIFGKKITGAYK